MIVNAIRTGLAGAPLDWMPQVMLVFLLCWRPWAAYSPRGSLAALIGMCQTVLVMLGLLAPSLAASPSLWVAIAAAQLSWIPLAYHAADNHQYLIGYWCLTVWLALRAGGERGSDILRSNATLLIGLCFLCAVISKLMSHRYRDGSMFAYLLLMDPRFLMLATTVAGVSAATQAAHAAASGLVRAEWGQVVVPISPRLQRTAVALSGWTIGVEALIAAVFLIPAPGFEGVRVASFVSFALPTYLFVAVPAFGQILTIMLAATVADLEMRTYLLSGAVALSLLTILPNHVMRLAQGHHRLQRREQTVDVSPSPKRASTSPGAGDHGPRIVHG
jgi:hypothetical protein